MFIPKHTRMVEGRANDKILLAFSVLITPVTTSPIRPRQEAHANKPQLADNEEKHCKKTTVGEPVRM